MRTRLYSSVFFALVLGVGAATTVMQGCSSMKVDENDPASLMKDIENEISGSHYQTAIDKLRELKNRFPYSKYSVDAALRIADVYYLMGDSYEEAAASYEAFRDLHPKHEKAPYAMYRIGKSYYMDMPASVGHDLASAQKAVTAYNTYLEHFPNDQNAADARKELAEARGKLAERELRIGNFYYRRDLYVSAKGRYKKLLALYPDSTAAKEASDRLAKIDKMTPEQLKEYQPNARLGE